MSVVRFRPEAPNLFGGEDGSAVCRQIPPGGTKIECSEILVPNLPVRAIGTKRNAVEYRYLREHSELGDFNTNNFAVKIPLTNILKNYTLVASYYCVSMF